MLHCLRQRGVRSIEYLDTIGIFDERVDYDECERQSGETVRKMETLQENRGVDNISIEGNLKLIFNSGKLLKSRFVFSLRKLKNKFHRPLRLLKGAVRSLFIATVYLLFTPAANVCGQKTRGYFTAKREENYCKSQAKRVKHEENKQHTPRANVFGFN